MDLSEKSYLSLDAHVLQQAKV